MLRKPKSSFIFTHVQILAVATAGLTDSPPTPPPALPISLSSIQLPIFVLQCSQLVGGGVWGPDAGSL